MFRSVRGPACVVVRSVDRAGAGYRPRQARGQDRRPGRRRPGHPGHQAGRRHDPVIGAEDGGTQPVEPGRHAAAVRLGMPGRRGAGHCHHYSIGTGGFTAARLRVGPGGLHGRASSVPRCGPRSCFTRRPRVLMQGAWPSRGAFLAAIWEWSLSTPEKGPSDGSRPPGAAHAHCMRTTLITRLAVAGGVVVGLAACGGARSPGTQPGTGTTTAAPALTTAAPSASPPVTSPRGAPTGTAPPARPSPRPSGTSPASPGAQPVTGWLAGKDWTVIPTARRVVALTFDAGANADAVPSILATCAAGASRPRSS